MTYATCEKCGSVVPREELRPYCRVCEQVRRVAGVERPLWYERELADLKAMREAGRSRG